MTGRLVVLALLVGLLAACSDESGSDSAGGCVAVLEVDGATYYGRGSDLDVPTSGEETDAVIPACNDAGADVEDPEPVRAALIADLPPEVAVVHDGELYVREGVQLPPSTGDWYPSLSCGRPDEFPLPGRLESVSEPYQPHVDPILEAPYEIGVRPDNGPHAGVLLDVQVTDESESVLEGTTPDTLPTRVDLRVRCAGGEYVAVSVADSSP